MTEKTIVLVSGGNAGLGYEVVKKLANDHPSTHRILMGTRSLDKGKSAVQSMGSPPNVTPIQLDVTSDDSILAAFQHVESTYRRLDILVNNAGTAGNDLGPRENTTLRQKYEHVYSVNVTSTAVLTDTLLPLLEKSSLPKIIFVSSALGSIGAFMNGYPIIPVPYYNSSKSAMNMLAAYYARTHPDWKVNAVCPGLNKTGLSDQTPLNEETDPKNGAIRTCQLVEEGKDGVTGTYSNKEGPLPW